MPAERRVSECRGWADEKSSIFVQPAGHCFLLRDAWDMRFWHTTIGFSQPASPVKLDGIGWITVLAGSMSLVQT
jgi:hypothetical protein